MRDEIHISFPPCVAVPNVPLLKSVSGFKRYTDGAHRDAMPS